MQEIVRIVENASSREVVRERCRSKQKWLGTGTVQVSGDEIVLTAKPAKGVTPEDIIAFCKGQMAAYKYPRHVEFLSEIPKTPTGKYMRRVLRNEP